MRCRFGFSNIKFDFLRQSMKFLWFRCFWINEKNILKTKLIIDLFTRTPTTLPQLRKKFDGVDNIDKDSRWTEAAFLSCSYKKVFLKYTRSLQESTHAEVRSQIILWHVCSPLKLLHIFITPFPKNTSGRLPL